MTIYIPQNIDPYNTHLKNLIQSYTNKGVKVLYGYEDFLSSNMDFDFVHFHHIEGVLVSVNYNLALFYKRLENYKKNGVKIIYTAHNVLPHKNNNKINYRAIISKFLTFVDLIVHHGNASINIFKREFGVVRFKNHLVCRHGDYWSDMGVFTDSRKVAKRKLGLPRIKKLILVFGQLQYKNSKFVKSVIKQLRKNHNVFLVMAGVNPMFKYNRINHFYYIINNSILNKFRVYKTYRFGRFSQYDTYLFFKSADVIFLPHNSGLTTGLIPLAATLSKPFVYPDIGVFEEQAQFCLSERYQKESVEGAVIALDKLLNTSKSGFDNSKWMENNNWDKHVDLILDKVKFI